MLRSDIVMGASLLKTFQKKNVNDQVLYRDDKNGSYFGLDKSKLSRHVLLLGSAGSGKTNVFNLTMDQLRNRNDDKEDIYIFFDTKGDFKKNFFVPGDSVIGNGRDYRGISRVWNIFQEILADGMEPEDYMQNARELSSSLFVDKGSESQPFFRNAAQDIFTNLLIHFIRENSMDPVSAFNHQMNNEALKRFLDGEGIETYRKIFRMHPDMNGLLSYIGENGSETNQALGVFGVMKNMASECFTGIFAKNNGSDGFSMREAVRRKGGRAIFIEYDLAVGESLTPIYRILIDLALKEALGRQEGEFGNVYMVLDELKLLPKLQHLDDALNFGRGMGVKVIAGLQSINQLYDIYGKEKGLVIAGGFSTIFAFHTSDSASREYVSDLFGNNLESYRYTNAMDEYVIKERDGKTVEVWDQTSLEMGDAVIGLADEQEPFRFHFSEYKKH